MPMAAFRPAVVAVDELPLFLTVDQVAEILGMGRQTAYDAVHRGQIPAVKFGRRLRVPRHALLALGLPEAGGADASA